MLPSYVFLGVVVVTTSLWVASDHSLMPSDEAAAALCAKLKVGQIVRADVSRVRSPDQLRLWWALVQLAFDAQSYYGTLEDFAAAVKCALGHCHVVVRPDGSVIQRPKSIALGNLSQEAFNQFFDAAEKLLSEKMGVTVESLREESRIPLKGERELAAG